MSQESSNWPPRLTLVAALALEAAAAYGVVVGQLAVAAVAHALGTLAATLACAWQSPEKAGWGPALLTGLTTFTLPPLGVFTALVAWRSSGSGASEGLLDELYEELHEGPRRPERIEESDPRVALLDAIDLEPYADALRYGDLDLRRGAIERLQDEGGPERIPVLRRALRDPDDEIRALALSALAGVEEQLNRAVVAATQEVRRSPKSPEAHAALGDRLAEFCYLRVADASYRSHYHALAFRCYATAIELSEDPARDAELITSLGRMLLSLGHATAARDAFDLAVRSAPADPRPLLWRAEVHLALGDMRALEADCRRALELDPGTKVREAASFWVPDAEVEVSSRDFRPTLIRRRERLAQAPEVEGDITPAEVQEVLRNIGRLPWEATVEQEDLRAAVEELLPRLTDEDPGRRGRALQELFSYTSDEAVEVVSDLLRGREATVRRVWVRYLARVGNVAATRELVGLLDDADPEVRDEAAVALGGLRGLPGEKAGLLLQSLQSGSPRVRAFAAEALGASRLERAVLPLIDCLEDPDRKVRLAVVEGLRLADDPRASRPLAALVTDPDEEVRYRVIHTLGALEGGPAPRALPEVLAVDESSRVRLVAAWTLATLAKRRAIEPLGRALEGDPEPRVRIEVCRRLGKLAHKRCVAPLLRAHALDPDHGVRLAASFALDLVPPERALRPLERAAHDPDPQLRFSAVTKLGDLPETPRAEEVLAAVLERDQDPIVRAGAAASLGRLGSDRVLPTLEQALADPDEAVAYAATVAFMILLVPAGLSALERHLATDPALTSLQRQALLRFAKNMAEGTALPPKVLKLALDGLSSADANVRYLAAEVLGAAREQAALQRILEAAAREPFADTQEAMEQAAARIVRGFPDPLLDRLEEAPDAPTPEQRAVLRATLRSLSHVRCRASQVVSSYLRLLTLRRRLVRLEVLPAEYVSYLSYLGQDPKALLQTTSTSDDPEVLIPAAKAIGELAGLGVRRFGDTKPLRALIDHPNGVVQAEALAALGALGDPGLFRTLVHLSLQSEDAHDVPVRAARRAVRALTGGGPRA